MESTLHGLLAASDSLNLCQISRSRDTCIIHVHGPAKSASTPSVAFGTTGVWYSHFGMGGFTRRGISISLGELTREMRAFALITIAERPFKAKVRPSGHNFLSVIPWAGVSTAPRGWRTGSWRKTLLHKVPYIWILRSTLSINLSRSGDPFDR